MNLFFDTSSLFKLYHKEADSDRVETILLANDIETIFLSVIARVEFASTVWKKRRMKEITTIQAEAILGAFEGDEGKYTFAILDNAILEQAKMLFTKYGEQGLRTLDSIQLATAVSIRTQVQQFICSDKLLHTFLAAELLPTW